MKQVLVVIIGLALFFVAGCKPKLARQKNPEDVSPKQVSRAMASFTSDAEFLQTVGRANRQEVELAQIAQSKAQDADVKKFAERMAKNHNDMNNALQIVAKEQNIQIPTDLDDAQKNFKSQLESQSGKSFDKTYMSTEVKNHEQMLTLLQGAMEKSRNQAVRDFATVQLITLRDDADAARAAAKKVGG